VKLGGSVITDKAVYRAARQEQIGRLARELASSPEPVVVVHGAGSFGHVVAKKHDLARGDDGDVQRRRAFARVLADVRHLQLLVVEALSDAGLAPLPLSTYDLGRLIDGKLAHYPSHSMKRLVDMGWTPVIPGDGAPDAVRRFGILSGDALMLSLARELRPHRTLFVTDVDGVYDRDPREPHPRLLERIAVHDAEAGHHGHGAAKGADVTGAMAGKLDRAAAIARLKLDVRIVNGNVPGRLADALAGRDVTGTRVVA
jgi:isopentenyl phosphate kinase